MTTPDQDPGLSALYQSQATGEPSPSLDRRILAAARNAAQPIEPATPVIGWWPRWRLPLSVAATVALSASLVLLLERQPSETVVESSNQIVARAPSAAESVAAPTAPIEPTATVSAEAAKQESEPVAQEDKPALTASLSDLPPLPEPPAPTKADKKPAENESAASHSVAEKRETAKPEPGPEVSSKNSAAADVHEKKESVKPSASAAPEAVKPTPPAAAPSTKSAEKATDKKESPKPAENRVEKAAAQKVQPKSNPASDDFEIKAVERNAAEPPPGSFDATDGGGIAVVRTASVWLEEIRALFKAGKEDKARQQLKEFRVAYPNAMIPYDLTEKK